MVNFILPAASSAFDEDIVLSGIHCRINFYDPYGREIPGRRELRRFSHLAGSVEPTLELASDTTQLQNDAARALEEINARRQQARR